MNIYTQEWPQSRNTEFPTNQKKERWRQNKRHIRNNLCSNKKLLQRNRHWMICRKRRDRGLNQFYSRETFSLILCSFKLQTYVRSALRSSTSSVKHHTWKHAYSNTLIILQPKKENFQIKKIYIFHIPAQNIDCGYSLEPPRRVPAQNIDCGYSLELRVPAQNIDCGYSLEPPSNEYPQSMFWAK